MKRPSRKKPALTPLAIQELARGFQPSRVLLTAYELKLFTALGSAWRRSAEVAAALGTAPRSTDRLMNALCALGLLRKRAGRFANTPASAECLVEGRPGYLGQLGHTVHLWDSWSTLTEAVRQGKAVGLRPVNDRGSEWLSAFIAAMHAFSAPRGAGVARQLDLRRVARVLDVGGGSGAYALAFARARPGLQATVFDLPNVVPLTQHYIQGAGLSDRVSTAVGDFLKDPLPAGYDLAFVSSIIHMLPPEGILALFRKCVQALRPGGQIVIQDFIMDEDRTRPPDGAMFALNMLVNTAAGDTYTRSEVRSWLEAAGFGRVTFRPTDFGTMLVVARLPD